MTSMAIGDILSYVLVHCTPIKSLTLSLSLEPISSPITDDHSHHATCEAWLDGIFWGAPTGVTVHHW